MMFNLKNIQTSNLEFDDIHVKFTYEIVSYVRHKGPWRNSLMVGDNEAEANMAFYLLNPEATVESIRKKEDGKY